MTQITKTVGTIDIPFEVDRSNTLKDHRAYYGKTQLTDQYYIINNVYIADNGELYRSGKHKLYVYGDVREGDPIATSPLHGIGVAVVNRDLAFAIARESFDSYINGKVGLIDVVLI